LGNFARLNKKFKDTDYRCIDCWDSTQ